MPPTSISKEIFGPIKEMVGVIQPIHTIWKKKLKREGNKTKKRAEEERKKNSSVNLTNCITHNTFLPIPNTRTTPQDKIRQKNNQSSSKSTWDERFEKDPQDLQTKKITDCQLFLVCVKSSPRNYRVKRVLLYRTYIKLSSRITTSLVVQNNKCTQKTTHSPLQKRQFHSLPPPTYICIHFPSSGEYRTQRLCSFIKPKSWAILFFLCAKGHWVIYLLYI